MKPSAFFNEVKAYKAGTVDCTLCDLHKPCKFNKLCTSPQSHKMIDFDEIKDFYCKTNKISAIKSVDGITYSPADSSLFFIEIKSWKNVIYPPHTNTPADNQIIENKAQEYANDIKDKISSSFTICQSIASNPQEFNAIHRNIVLITDIDTSINAVELISANLNFLAATSNAKSSFCNNEMLNALSNQNLNIHYWHCKDFDSNIATY